MKKITTIYFMTLTFIVAIYSSIFAVEEIQPGRDALMAQWQAYAAPGPHHRHLDVFEGQWTYTVKTWMSPDSEPEVSAGTYESKWILDGRFLQQTAMGRGGPMPFEGFGIVGFDNMKGAYCSVWVDTMSTGMMISTMEYDASAGSFLEQGTYSDPMTGEQNRPFKGVCKIVDQNHFTYNFFVTGPEGKEFRMMELEYERKK